MGQDHGALTANCWWLWIFIPQPIGSIMFHSIVALDPFPVSTVSKHREETTSDQRKEQLGMGPLAKWKNTWAYQMPVKFP